MLDKSLKKLFWANNYVTNDKKCFSAAEEPCTVQLLSTALRHQEIQRGAGQFQKP